MFNDPKTVQLRPDVNKYVLSDSSAVEGDRCSQGILFLFHRCTRYAASFFYSPQGLRLISLASKAGIEVVVFEKNNKKGCWNWKDDGEMVRERGRKIMKSRKCGVGAKFPPIWAFGASSGGNFIATLAAQMEEDPSSYSPFLFSAINVQISSPPKSLDWDIPTVFTLMNGDARTKE